MPMAARLISLFETLNSTTSLVKRAISVLAFSRYQPIIDTDIITTDTIPSITHSTIQIIDGTSIN
jgi:hypothetical protein